MARPFHQLIAEAGGERLRQLHGTELRIPRIDGYRGVARSPEPWSSQGQIGHVGVTQPSLRSLFCVAASRS